MLLINPAREQFGGIMSRYVPVSIPVAIGLLAAYLRKWGVKDIAIIDEELTPVTAAKIIELTKPLKQPMIVGITVLTFQAGRAYEIARMCKELLPGCIVIAGGIHVTSLPNEALQTGDIDIVVRGEGEETLRQLYYAIQQKKDWQEIKGISFLDEKGEVVHNPDADLIENLDDVPIFPYELFEHPKYDLGSIPGARGCPYSCTYCSQRLVTGFTYRWHSKERVVENIRILVEKYGVTQVSFIDDVFSVNKRRVLDLCDAIVESGLHKRCSFAIQTRADNLYEEIMPALIKANFRNVGFGMETGVERIAKEIQKDESVQLHLEKIELCKKYGLNVSLFMIYGFPNESKEDRDESFRVVQKAAVGFAKFNNLIPYPGTPLYRLAQEKGKFHVEKGWSNFNSTLSFTRSIFSPTPLPYMPEGTSEFELKRDIIKRNMQYYFQWRIIKKILVRDKGVGFVQLPRLWFLKPVEIMSLTKLTTVMICNLLFTLVPLPIGNVVNSWFRKEDPMKAPADVSIETRTFRRASAPKVDGEDKFIDFNIEENKRILPAVR